MKNLILAFVAAASFVSVQALAVGAPSPGGYDDEQSVVVLKGTIESGLASLGGEGTGVVLHTTLGTVEIDLGTNGLATPATGATVMVKGFYTTEMGPETGLRKVFVVQQIKRIKL